jgi:hypothetical protein
MNTTTNTATARRITTGSKTHIEVTLPDGTIKTLGGKRAERATVVLVSKWWGVTTELRSDAAKAQDEARINLRGRVVHGQKADPAEYSLVVEITD